MRARFTGTESLFLCVLICFAGCALPSLLRGRIEQVRRMVILAEQEGAKKCVPRLFAFAQVRLEFATNELLDGNLSRSQAHLEAAEAAASAALRLSSSKLCWRELQGGEESTDATSLRGGEPAHQSRNSGSEPLESEGEAAPNPTR
ncbi:MAG: hypothetical protein NZM37_11505 [Sandaracinaceae bacterium]|nr:hypothetical protein [Sandaracinaceae bacterium]